MGSKDVAVASYDESLLNVSRRLNSQNPEILPGQGPDTVGIHWLRGTLEEEHLAWLVMLFSKFFGDGFRQHTWGFWRYDGCFQWPNGVLICHSITPENRKRQNGKLTFDIQGNVCHSMDMWSLGMMILDLAEKDYVPTRIDAHFDDHDRVISPKEILAAIYEESLFPHAPIRHDWIGFRKLTPKPEIDSTQGLVHDELVFGRAGKRGGDSTLSIYDKYLESVRKEEIEVVDAIRYECRLTGAKAVDFSCKLVRAFKPDFDPMAMVRVIGQTVGASIDFRHRTDRIGDKNLDRLDRYDWWQRILDKIGSAKLIGKQLYKTVARAARWVGRGVIPSLQMLLCSFGEKDFKALIWDRVCDRDRMNNNHVVAIEEFVHLPLIERESVLSSLVLNSMVFVRGST